MTDLYRNLHRYRQPCLPTATRRKRNESLATARRVYCQSRRHGAEGDCQITADLF